MKKFDFTCRECLALIREAADVFKPSAELRDAWIAERIDLRTEEGFVRAAELTRADMNPRKQEFRSKLDEHHAQTGHWPYLLGNLRPMPPRDR